MPYITLDQRDMYDCDIDEIVDSLSKAKEQDVPGHLNYIIFTIVYRFLKKKGIRYHRLNYLLGAIQCCWAEIYRRLAAPYENKAADKNGDIDDLGDEKEERL